MTPAMREGLVFLVSEEGGDWQLEFVHDEIEEAVYSLIPEVDRKKMHLRFGRVLMREVLPMILMTGFSNHGPCKPGLGLPRIRRKG